LPIGTCHLFARELSINLLFIGIIVGIIGDICARAYYVNDIYIDRRCSIYIVQVGQAGVPYRRTLSAILKGSKARSFSGACAP